jgi:hypothetical protein
MVMAAVEIGREFDYDGKKIRADKQDMICLTDM